MEGINGLENPKLFYRALEFITIYVLIIYIPSILGIYATSEQKIKF